MKKLVEQKIRQTRKGEDYKVFVLDDGKYLSVFKFDSRYNDLQAGMELDDSLLVFDPEYGNYKLKPLPKSGAYVKGAGGYKPMEAVMEKKQENISTNMDRKEQGIRLSGAMRDATQISLAELRDTPFPTPEEYKERWIYWTKWLLSQGEQPFL